MAEWSKILYHPNPNPYPNLPNFPKLNPNYFLIFQESSGQILCHPNSNPNLPNFPNHPNPNHSYLYLQESSGQEVVKFFLSLILILIILISNNPNPNPNPNHLCLYV